MAGKSDYVTGTITLTNGQASFSGTGSGWQLAQIREGDTVIDVTGATEFMGVIASITDNTSGTLTKPWEGPDVTAEYRIRYMADGQRSTAQARLLIELLGNGRLTAIAAAAEPAGVIEMLPGGSARLVPLTDLVSGANYDVQVANMAARAAFDGQVAGFAVLVADTGDGRAAIFSKLSNASGDWSAAAYVTGPPITLDITEVDEVPYGAPPDVTLTPRAGGYDVSFVIPRGMIIEPGATTTLASDQPAAVTFVPVTGGYRVDFAIPRGPTGDIDGVTPFWVTRLGSDADATAARTGLGAVGAPGSAADNRIAVFDGDGNLLKDGGKTIAELTPANGSVTNVKLADMAQATIKGRAAGAGTGVPGDLTAAQVLAITDAYAKSNILGAVSQSAGVPTGAVIERGSNANGEYVRFADGTQICTRTQSYPSVSFSNVSGSIYFAASAPAAVFPVSFSVLHDASIKTFASGKASWAATGNQPTLSSWPNFYAFAEISGTAPLVVYYFAIGRWF
ncbi:hypothetical protein [Devosia limi]|uniref:Uncharacterized protein n=1 Tax=Devosia limi DSM 17137 TaxID=1121477 RepID=A0A1M4X1P9_9HYPH|nr:hypothetical protein [Devosia limi]SHE87426.1 hypothetical protein SAMN02745223_01288 [Devosia limi DSM 17137]